MFRLRLTLAFWLRNLAWKLDPRPELREQLSNLIQGIDPQDTPFGTARRPHLGDDPGPELGDPRDHPVPRP